MRHEKVEMVKAILKHQFVTKDDFRPAMMGVYNDGEVVVATNGRILAEIDLSQWSDLSVIEHSISSIDTFPNYKDILPVPEANKVYKVNTQSLYTDPEDIKESDNDTLVDCPCCRGRGWIRYDCGCEHCDYDHSEDCERCEATGEIPKNAKYSSYTDIHWVYSGVTSRFVSESLNSVVALLNELDVCTVNIYQKKASSPLLVEGKGVRLLASPFLIDFPLDEYSEVVNNIRVEKGSVLEAAV